MYIYIAIEYSQFLSISDYSNITHSFHGTVIRNNRSHQTKKWGTRVSTHHIVFTWLNISGQRAKSHQQDICIYIYDTLMLHKVASYQCPIFIFLLVIYLNSVSQDKSRLSINKKILIIFTDIEYTCDLLKKLLNQ